MINELTEMAAGMEKELLSQYKEDITKIAQNAKDEAVQTSANLLIRTINKYAKRKISNNPSLADIRDSLEVVRFITVCSDFVDKHMDILETSEEEDAEPSVYIKYVTDQCSCPYFQVVCPVGKLTSKDETELADKGYAKVEKDALLHLYADEYPVTEEEEEDVKAVDIKYDNGDLKVTTTGIDDKEHGKLERMVAAFFGFDLEPDEEKELEKDCTSEHIDTIKKMVNSLKDTECRYPGNIGRRLF